MKKEYLVLAVIIGLLSAYLLVQKTDRSNYELPDIKEVLGSEITAVEIKKADNNVLLTKEGDTWVVTARKYPVDSAKIEKILGIVQKLTVTALVSETGELKRYHLDSEKSIRVTARKGDEIARQFELGKAAPTYRHTFLKLSGDDNVYHAAGSFRSDFDQTSESFRDKKVLAFKSGEIGAMALEKGGISSSFIKTEVKTDDTDSAEKSGIWTGQDGSEIDNEPVKSLLATIGSLDCSSFSPEAKSKVQASKPLCKIDVTGAKVMTLFLYEKGADGTYPGITSESDYSFFLSGYQADSILEKIDTILGIKTVADDQ